MAAVIKKQFKLEFAEQVGVLFMVLLFATVFGQVLMALIAHFDSTVKRHVQVSTIMTLVFGLVFVGITILHNIRLQFHIQVSMGCTRKRFFVSYYLMCFAVALAGWIMIMVVAFLEETMNPILYSDLESANVEMIPYLLKWGIPVSTALVILCNFCGILMMRFGRIATGILWVVWMVACLGFPNLDDAVENMPNSLFGKLGGGVLYLIMRIPVPVWIALGVGICVACLIASYLMIRKLEVKP